MTPPKIHFVISAPRSGSTWLASALNQHPEIFATEQRLFGNFCEMWPNNNGNMAPRMTFDAFARAFSVHYSHEDTADSRAEFIREMIAEFCNTMAAYSQRKTGKSVIVDKITPYPGTSKFVVQQIKEFFPDAKIIQLVRDGRDVLTSGAFDWLLKDAQDLPRYKYFVSREPGFAMTRFFDDPFVKKWANHWKETIAVFGKNPVELTIKYESMLAEHSAVLQAIFETLNVDASNDVARKCADAVTFENQTGRPNGTMEATSKQRQGKSGDWKNYMTKTDGQLFDSIAGEQLSANGYEVGSSWIDELPNQLPFVCQPNSDGTLAS